MTELNWDELKASDLKSLDELIEAYKAYLMRVLGYDKSEAELASTDMTDPYNVEYVLQEYDGDYEVEGKEYEVRYCYTNFCYCGLFHLADKEPFEFYMFFDKSTLPDQTVGSYTKADKKFIF